MIDICDESNLLIRSAFSNITGIFPGKINFAQSDLEGRVEVPSLDARGSRLFVFVSGFVVVVVVGIYQILH